MSPFVRELPAGLRLAEGSHRPPNGEFEACVMEAVAYVAGEEWSDSPKCACPVISAFMRSWNDALADDERQMLMPYVRRLVNTKSTPEVEEARSWLATDWLVRECAPAWLRLAGLTDHAEALERLAPLVDDATAIEGQEQLSAAWSAAWSAARSAAESAAWSAARSAARSAAWSAAWSAARSAARSAAWSAARSAAESAAESAASEALDPTRRGLQVSALRLLDRMLGVEA